MKDAPFVEYAMQVVERVTGKDRSEWLHSTGRRREQALPRMLFAYVLRSMEWRLTDIASIMGRDHSTISYYLATLAGTDLYANELVRRVDFELAKGPAWQPPLMQVGADHASYTPEQWVKALGLVTLFEMNKWEWDSVRDKIKEAYPQSESTPNIIDFGKLIYDKYKPLEAA